MTGPKKRRADELLVAEGLAENRSRARALIMAGKVFAGERRVDKAGELVAANRKLEVRGPGQPWASRGGVKLAHGLEHFGIDPAGWVALDIGASTGGFTDVLLSRGAKKVYAVDVGRGQLDWRLRQDEHVIVLEGVNARYLTREQIPEAPQIITCDASFISLKTVLPAALDLAAADAVVVALIKPQFEAGRGNVGKGGVVRDVTVRQRVIAEIEDWLNGLEGWRVEGVTESPITGPKGNVEYLIAARRHAG